MFRMSALTACAVTLSGCLAVQTFDSVTENVNEEFALGAQLRDRCSATGDIDHCQAWIEYKRSEEADNPLMDYDAALARWEAKGPY